MCSMIEALTTDPWTRCVPEFTEEPAVCETKLAVEHHFLTSKLSDTRRVLFGRA